MHGQTSFGWLEGGAFLVMRSTMDHAELPDGTAIIGTDSITQAFGMTYFDTSGHTRLFEVTVGHRTLTWRGCGEPLGQCNMIVAAEDGRTLVSTGRMSDPGCPWSDDLWQSFTRIDDAEVHPRSGQGCLQFSL